MNKKQFILFAVLLSGIIFQTTQARVYENAPTLRFFELKKSLPFNTELASLLDDDFQKSFSPIKGIDSREFKHNEEVFYRIDLKRSASTDHNDFYLLMRASHYEYMEAILVEDGKILETTSAGFLVSGRDRNVLYPDLILPLDHLQGKDAQIYIKTKINAKMPTLPEIVTLREVSRNAGIDLFFIVMYISALGILIIYQIFSYFNLRDKASLTYVLFCSTMLLSALGRSGYFDLFWSPYLFGFKLSEWQIYLIAANLFSAILFTQSYFNLKESFPKIHLLYNVIGITAIVSIIVFSIIDPGKLWKVVPLINSVGGIITVVFSAYAVKKKQIGATYYFVAWTGFILGITLFNMMTVGAIAMPWYMRYITYVAGMYECVTMAFGLSHRLRKYRELEMLNENEKKENQSLHRLIRVLCHDVANPLSVVSGSADFALKFIERGDIEKSKERIMKVQKSAKIIAGIIDEVRSLEAQGSGKLQVDLKPVDIESCVQNAMFMFEDRCHQKQIQLVFTKNGSGKVIADQNALQTNVIANILSNAIKFSQPGSDIEIGLKETNEFMVLSIRDFGIGIPAESLKKIFTMEGIASRPGTQNEHGTGFGMLLIKSFVESFGGQVHIESKTKEDSHHDHGTRIDVFLKKSINQSAEAA